MIGYGIGCDVCDDRYPTDWPTIRDLRAETKNMGWKRVKRADIYIDVCPCCAAIAAAKGDA